MFISNSSELVTYFPQFWIEGVLEGALQQFHGGAAGADGTGADHAFGQLEVLGAEDLKDFVVIGESFGEGHQQRIAIGAHVDAGQGYLLMSKHLRKIIPEQW